MYISQIILNERGEKIATICDLIQFKLIQYVLSKLNYNYGNFENINQKKTAPF